MYPRGRELRRGLSDPVQLQHRRWAPGPQTRRNQPGTGLGQDPVNEDAVERATSLPCLELVRALLSHKLSAPKPGPCPPSPSRGGPSRTWMLGRCREPSAVTTLGGNGRTCSGHQTKSSCSHQMDAEHTGPADTHRCRCDLIKAELGLKTSF